MKTKVATLLPVAMLTAMAHIPTAFSAATGPAVPQAESIFTLGGGVLPVTDRARLGDRRLRAMEVEFAARLGLDLAGAGVSATSEQYAMRPICCSKTIDCEISPTDGCVNDTDDSF